MRPTAKGEAPSRRSQTAATISAPAPQVTQALSTPALEKYFYPNAATIAAKAHSMVRPDDPPWTPEAEPTLPHEAAFRGPF